MREPASGVTTQSVPPGARSRVQASRAASGSSRCSITSTSSTTWYPPSGRGELLHALLADVELEDVARVRGGRLRQLEAGHREAAAAGLVEQQAVATADVQEAAGRHLLLDQVEQAAGRLAPPRLLAQVSLV